MRPPEPDLAALARRARAGEEAAFAELHRRLAPAVHGVLLSLLRPAEADEACHEALAQAHRRLASLEEPAAVGAWVMAIARNHAKDRLRARRRDAARAGPIPPETAERRASPGGPGDDGELRERVLVHIRSLPETYRETLLLRLVEGLGGAEIAAITGLAPGSVRVNLHRGMELLRPLLRREGWP